MVRAPHVEISNMRLTGAGSRSKQPLEYSLLYTATLCLMAFGAVMVYSASSAESLISTGDSFFYLKRYLAFGLLGLLLLHFLSRHGVALARRATALLLFGALALSVVVMVPGIGVHINGAARWLSAGPIQFQPSELLKLALVLYAARLLAARPDAVRSLRTLVMPLFLVVGASCLLVLKEPDMGTAVVICLAITCLVIGAGTPLRYFLLVGGLVVALGLVLAVAEPYRQQRLTAFLNPWHDPSGIGFQIVQSMIAIGSGGFFGVGLGESVQKIFYLPEAHTDMILAIIGEEVGLVGVVGVGMLYGLIAYAGMRVARFASDRYSQLVAIGLTSLVVCQAGLNFLAVVGMAPLTGVPLPLISYGSSNLIVLLAAMGILLNAAAARDATVEKRRTSADDLDTASTDTSTGSNRGWGNGRPRNPSPRSGRPAAQ
jgi:cell division protein FtsW